jgi:hypothetical protein
MDDLFWLSPTKMRRIEFYFPLSHGIAQISGSAAPIGQAMGLGDNSGNTQAGSFPFGNGRYKEGLKLWAIGAAEGSKSVHHALHSHDIVTFHRSEATPPRTIPGSHFLRAPIPRCELHWPARRPHHVSTISGRHAADPPTGRNTMKMP